MYLNQDHGRTAPMPRPACRGLRAPVSRAALLGAALLLGPAMAAHATMLPTDLAITGNWAFDTTNSFVDGGATQSGSYSATEGGTTTTTTYADTTVTGTDPLAGTLTAMGDGFSITGTVAASADGDEFLSGVDLVMNLANNSLTDTYRVVLGIVFNNRVDADGDDAFADSELTLEQPVGTEVFFTDITSDTFFGDEKNGTGLGTFGALVEDNGTASLILDLLPGTTEVLAGAFTLEGGVFADPSSATGTYDFALTIDRVTNLTAPPPPTPAPEPGTMLLLGAGLLGLARARRRRAGGL